MVKYIQNYVLYEQIGFGVYGKVFRSINNNDKKEYAIKVIPINKFKENKKLEECTVNQINILTNIEHNQHIIRYYDMLKTSNNFYFIYEYCNGGTLESMLQKNGKLPEKQALLIFKQLLEAFQILNKYNIMHRDMKPDNIFFHNGVIKLGDFGFCKNLNSADEMTKTMLGSPIYMAPEVLKGEQYSNKADIWSLGVVLYEMIYAQCPFQSNSIAKLIEVLDSQTLYFPNDNTNITPFLKNLITRMLTKDPNRRISWMETFKLKISAEGMIESEKMGPTISSLSEAKILNEVPMTTSSSNGSNGSNGSKQVPLVKAQSLEESTDTRNFKKKTNQNGAPLSEAKINQANNYNNSISTSQNYQPSSYGQKYEGSGTNIDQQGRSFCEQHFGLIEGVKLAMQIVDSKVTNHLGYSFILLSKTEAGLAELMGKSSRKEIKQVIEHEMGDIKKEKDLLGSKLFPYEMKGIEDWKKYLRGKFFEEEKTIPLWYKMVMFLSKGSLKSSSTNVPYKTMVDTIKTVLY